MYNDGERLPVGAKVNLIDNTIPPMYSSTHKSEKNEPSYYVHMVVPDQKSTTVTPAKTTSSSAITDVNDFLSKIISASKGSNKIFVVPIPGSFANGQKDFEKIDLSKFDESKETTTLLEDEESLITSRKSEIINGSTLRPHNVHRSGEQPYGEVIHAFNPMNNGEDYSLQHSQAPQQQQQQSHNPPKSYYLQSQPQSQAHFPQQQQQQSHFPQTQPHYSQAQPQSPHSQQNQQYRPPPHSRPHHPPPNFEQGTGNRAYIPKASHQQPVSYYHQPEGSKTTRDSQFDSNRWGSVESGGYGHSHGHELPKGITVTFGSSPGVPGAYASDYHHQHHVEPLSVIKNLFLPFLPKPRVNLNGRVVFGVVLEKGVGLGGNKGGGGTVSLGGYH